MQSDQKQAKIRRDSRLERMEMHAWYLRLGSFFSWGPTLTQKEQSH